MTKVEICNKSLTLLGASPITSLSDDTANARALNRIYDSSLRSILSECRWSFATKRRLLSSVTDTLEWYDSGETVVYARPADTIRIFGTNDDSATWREEGDYIISDTTGLGVRYTYFLDDPSKYPAAFVEAFVDKLSSDIAFTILNSQPKAESMLQKYETVSLPKARSENAQIGTHQYLKDDAWDLARYSDGTYDA